MAWNPTEHSDDENLTWCWLRAVEWGRWPIFLSQPIAPVFMIWLSWQSVVMIAVAANLLWAFFVRYRFVSVRAAYIGVTFVLSKWVFWPLATAYLFYQGRRPECWIALAWPAIIFIIGGIPTTRIGRIQALFMRALGYEPSQLNPLSQHA